ncbi:MAG: patatin-like phospholipase family protein [Flavobacteriales bacterium]|nr:patatin-like phospholipase family protein [Flavobacteriales bacterium]
MLQGKRLIISIDGGGIRGVIPLVILREIQLMLNKNLNEYHPQWWGTSTGSVIGAGLNVQEDPLFIHRIQKILDLYEFRSDTALNPNGTEHPARAFNKLIDYNFGDLQLANYSMLNLVACSTDTLKPYVFNSLQTVLLREAVKASCAVPTIFPTVKIGDREFVDGFVVAKNPAMLAVEGLELDENLVVLSLGCGILRVEDDIEKQVVQTHELMSRLSVKKGFHYFRFDPVLQFAQDDMQNANPTNIFNLKKDAMTYLFENHHLVRDFVKSLD